MGYSFAPGDIAYLGSVAGSAALAAVAELDLTAASQLRDVALVRRTYGDRAPALIETVRLRRRAAGKLSGAQDWLLTDEALQQATPTLVARHRARRLAGRDVHDVTCSIGAELAELARVCPRVVGSDLDPVRLAIAHYNLIRPSPNPICAGSLTAGSRGPRPRGAAIEHSPDPPKAGQKIQLVRADALAPCTSGTVVVADPGRRADGKRTHDPAALQPPLPDLLSAYAGRDLVVKCAPGLDFDRLDWDGEVEVVSLDGGVREACLWSAGLREAGIARRATVLTSAGAISTLTDADPDEIPERDPGEWIVDPDGAVVRAGLVRHYGARHGLWQLDPRIAYLTGDRLPDGVRGFRILDRCVLREKVLRAELRRRDCGRLEILVRGVDIDPDVLRRRLKLTGSRPYTLVITRIGSAATVFLCEPSRP
ncbi:class I SAM-dependent methyltransferase [Nocardia sp. NBC_01329]|uniref:class I SAM-dependent methyltransferase n=1 Tax=Nocardia sp. NBC_01329 TaxID=2903594 RepID=UPI002E157D1B|nr:class I SAM-dependent methyltransferase [Nocardia sp. NBC_01329]